MKPAKVLIGVVCLMLAFLPSLSVSAFEPYRGYTYDEWDKGIPAANGYEPDEVYTGSAKDGVFLQSPKDLFVDDRGRLYLLNGENGGVLILNPDFTPVREITSFTLPDGGAYTLADARGIYVRDDILYIADYEGQCVLVADLEGRVKTVIRKPTNEVFPQEKEFRPLSVAVDGRKNLYVLVLDVYQGTVVFTADYAFKDFFGSTRLTPTLQMLANRFWQSVMTSAQNEAFSNYVPVLPNGMDITDDGFLYSCTGGSEYDESNIRCVNPAGSELWKAYGDLEFGVHKLQPQKTDFLDLAVADNGYVYALDRTMNRIFVYDKEQNLLFAFGGNSTQQGTFSQPVAIDTFGRKVYVLDAAKGCVTVFSPTEYGTAVFDALALYEDGQYQASRAGWEAVLRMNGNERLAYDGIGKALLYDGEYRQAMHYFKQAADRREESRAFALYRKAFLREHAPVIVVGIFLVLLTIVAVMIARRVRRNGRKPQ